MLPAQLSSLLPLLPKLMRPLVMALKGNDELVVLGLKTLECWVDSLNPEFLEPAMADVVHEVIPALWALLKPGHYNMTSQKSPAMMAMALLGKLGEWNDVSPRAIGPQCSCMRCRCCICLQHSQRGSKLAHGVQPWTPGHQATGCDAWAAGHMRHCGFSVSTRMCGTSFP